jgi:hypothetical protein
MVLKLYIGRELMPADIPPVPMLFPFFGGDPQLDTRLLEFHSAISAQDFEDLQLQSREFWRRWLAPESFFRVIAQQLSRYRTYRYAQKQ